VYAFGSRQPKNVRHATYTGAGLRRAVGYLSRVTGSSACEGAAITADEKNGTDSMTVNINPNDHLEGTGPCPEHRECDPEVDIDETVTEMLGSRR